MSDSAEKLAPAKTSGQLVVVSGPSGVGKSTIDKLAVAQTGASFSVSVTTRAPREGEVDGKDYHFVSEASFEAMAENGELLEHAGVFGNYYGTLARPVTSAIARGETILLEIDVQGGQQVAKVMPEATFVLIIPPSMAELRKRLNGRGTESDEALETRLAKAEKELAMARKGGVYENEIVNETVEQAVAELVAIIQPKEPDPQGPGEDEENDKN